MKKQQSIDMDSLLKEIYMNQRERKEKIERLLDTLQPLITDIAAAVNLLPEVVKLQQAGINNDDALIKLANVINKSRPKNDDDGDDLLNGDDYKQLLSKHLASDSVPGGSK